MSTQRPHSSWIEEDTQDNSTATATRAAPPTGLMHHITSIAGGYSATASGKTLLLKEGSTIIGRWRVYDSFALSFPSPIQVNGAANLELEASGTGGTDGDVTLTGFTL